MRLVLVARGSGDSTTARRCKAGLTNCRNYRPIATPRREHLHATQRARTAIERKQLLHWQRPRALAYARPELCQGAVSERVPRGRPDLLRKPTAARIRFCGQ